MENTVNDSSIKKLKLLVTVVDRRKGEFYLDVISQFDVNCQMALSLFVPPVYTAIAFDSGGVASGPMTSGFILPFATGVCMAIQGEGAVLRDAFGVVALVAMTPLITIQLLGFRAIISDKVKERRAMKRILDADDQQIINFM